MPTRPDAPDLAVDELQRRARRRLVGAIVLALAAAVILPFLLESEPKPLGDEISVRIPPVDSGKFLNPLTPRKGGDAGVSAADPKADPKAEPRPGAVLTPKKSIVDAERRVMGQGAAPPVPATANTPTLTPAPAPTSAPSPPAVTKSPAPPPTKPAAEQGAPSSAPSSSPGGDAPAPKSDGATAPPAAPAAATGGYAVQVGAFADAKVAGELVAALGAGGYATYTEAVPTPQGSVQRVRVGPFATRAAADAAVAKLKAAGHDRAMVINTK